ncbi:MAG: hypothetical protein ACJ735_00190 [Actinomycetes bacterium]
MPYRIASSDWEAEQPAGVLHAYRPGLPTTVCGLKLVHEVRIFVDWRWPDRPEGVRLCETCAKAAAYG